jgi:UDP-3-O-[3-hydroxymyristoyl] glucosamine N-acyltransferase
MRAPKRRSILIHDPRPEEAGGRHLLFNRNARSAARARIGVIVGKQHGELAIATLRADNPYLCFAEALTLFHRPLRPAPGIHPTAVVAASARVAEPVSVGPYAVIGENVVIGPGAIIHPHVTIYAGVQIGRDFVAHAGVVVREHVRLGDRVILHGGVVLGSDGFGFMTDKSALQLKVPQIGRVVLEDDVEVGANSCIDRATTGVTRVRRGTKIDNLVQVAHNCEVGAHSFLAAQVGIAGSTKIGRGVQMGGQAGAAGHLTIGDGVQVAAQSGVPNSVAAGTVVGGYPAIEVGLWRRTSAALLRLPELLRRVRRLERRIGAEAGRGDDRSTE